MTEKKITVFFIATAFISLVFFVWKNYAIYTKPYDHTFFSRIYTNSPYVKGPAASEGIGDDGLYAFAGYYYIQGGDISQVNFENPPLGKYLIGLSIKLFGNQNVINLIYGVIFLSAFYIFTYLLFKKHIWASIALAIASIDSFFHQHLSYSLLDLPLTVFFLLGMLFYIQAKKKSSFFFIAALFFGLAVSTKFFPGLILFLLIFSFDILKHNSKHFKIFFISLLVIPIIYLASHMVYFLHSSFFDFLRYQNWIIHWRLGNPRMTGNIILNVLTGHYRSWWGSGEWLVDKEWSPLTALAVLLSLMSYFLIKKKDETVNLFFTMTVVFFVYLAIGTVGYAKYILPVYPFIIILTVFLLRDRWQILKRKSL